MDSNHRSIPHLVYSEVPLTAWVIRQGEVERSSFLHGLPCVERYLQTSIILQAVNSFLNLGPAPGSNSDLHVAVEQHKDRSTVTIDNDLTSEVALLVSPLA